MADSRKPADREIANRRVTEFVRLVAELLAGTSTSRQLHNLGTGGYGPAEADDCERAFRLWLGLDGVSEPEPELSEAMAEARKVRQVASDELVKAAGLLASTAQSIRGGSEVCCVCGSKA